MGNKGFFGKIGKKLEKAVIPNIKQAEKILKSIDESRIRSPEDVINGKGSTLFFGPDDYISFANKENNNNIDKVAKIGKLLATSMLTTTTTNKRYGFEDVYKLFKLALEKYRNKLYVELKTKGEGIPISKDVVEQHPELDWSSWDVSEKFRYLCNLFQNSSKADEIISNMAKALYPVSLDAATEKTHKTARARFENDLIAYCKKINKSFGTISKVLKNNGFEHIIDDTLDEYSDEQIAKLSDGVFSKFDINLGDKVDLSTIRRSGVGKAINVVSRGPSLAAAIAFVCAMPGLSLVALGVGDVAYTFGILSVMIALTYSDTARRKFLVKEYKDNYNKLISGVTNIKKAIGAARRRICDELDIVDNEGEAQTGARKSSDKTGSGYMSQACYDIAKKFITEIREIWSNYADDTKRQYGYFEDQDEIRRLQGVIKTNEDKHKLIKELLTLLQDFDDGRHYKELHRLSAGKSFLAKLKELRNDKVVSELIKEDGSVGQFREYFYDQQAECLNSNAETESTILELKKKQTGRGEEKTSAMGKFKEGYAKTLVNSSYLGDARDLARAIAIAAAARRGQ